MRGFWILVHVLGFTLWLGGGIATMVAGLSAKGFAPAERLAAYKLIGAIQRMLVGPGAMAVQVPIASASRPVRPVAAPRPRPSTGPRTGCNSRARGRYRPAARTDRPSAYRSARGSGIPRARAAGRAS